MLDHLARAMERPPVQLDAEPHHQAAVVAVLYGEPPSVLLIERATVPGDPWSGHLAFPGGRREPHDETLRHTAARETMEELGLDLSDARWLGALDDVGPVSQRKPLVVRPFVVHVPRLPELRPNREVAGILDLTLSHLLANRDRGTMPYVFRNQSITLPTVQIGSRRLWGMTLRMVDDLLHRLDGGGVGLARQPGSPG
jgi:8-oxo-dGTP pyrophosphatase MutT (NUDIX family)